MFRHRFPRTSLWTAVPFVLLHLMVATSAHAQESSQSPATEPEIPPANAPADAETDQEESEDASSDLEEAENAEPVSEQQTNTSATPSPQGTENVDGAGASEEAEQVELEPGADFQTGIQGTIFEGENLEGLANAPVVIEGRGRTRSVNTNGQGVYRAFVPPGRYTVRSHYDLYHGARIAGLRVRRGRLLDVNLVLDPITADDAGIDEYEVAYTADTTSEVAQINLRREQTNVQDAVSAQEISRSGDSSASSAARRVVGVTIEGGNQLVVRGLGGRYSRTLVNGVAVPSTDPDVPGVQLDIFPTSILDSLSVIKTARPDIPGNFAGGVLMIDTTSFPREFVLDVGLSLGMNTETTFQDRLSYEGGSLDFLGFDDGTRALPNEVPTSEPLRVSRNGGFNSFDSIAEVGRSFQNTWSTTRANSLPGIGLDLSLGNSFEWNGNRAGFLATAGYGVDPSRDTGISRPKPGVDIDGQLTERNNYQIESGEYEVQWGALVAAGLEIGNDHAFQALSFFNRTLEDGVSLREGRSEEGGGFMEKWQLSLVTRHVFFNQIQGDHRNVGNTRLRLRWNLFGAMGGRSEPDRRTIIYGPDGGLDFRWLAKGGSGDRFYSDLGQVDYGGGTSLRFPLWQEAWGTIGGRIRESARDFTSRRFRMIQHPSWRDASVYETQPVETLFNDENLGSWTLLREFSRPDDSYSAESRLGAAYAMIETPLFAGLRLSGGARFEGFSQQLQSESPFGEQDDDAQGTNRVDYDILPSAALVLPVTDEHILRAAYSMTVARPQTRELAPYAYYDFVRERNISGNPDLRRTQVHNADLRWEWYLGGTDLFAASLFYKQFYDPIELVIRDPSSFDAAYGNAESATVFGGEMEMRLGLGRIHDSLADFTLGANIALVHSEVEISDEEAGAVNAERPLFGQSPYVANVSLRYHTEDIGLTSSLVYNVIGPRVVEAGVRISSDFVLPDVYEQPFHSLDLVVAWEANDHLKLKLKLKNLLFSQRELLQGDFLLQRRDPGASLSVGMSYSY